MIRTYSIIYWDQYGSPNFVQDMADDVTIRTMTFNTYEEAVQYALNHRFLNNNYEWVILDSYHGEVV